jgi:hypothetical protein
MTVVPQAGIPVATQVAAPQAGAQQNPWGVIEQNCFG